MKPVADELVMAYADGELDAATRAEVEAALAADPALAERAAALLSQRRRVEAAFQPLLEEAVPERLRRLLPPPVAPIDLAQARAARQARRPAVWAPSGWAAWGGLAASLVLGVLLGTRLPVGGAAFELRDGRVVAGGPLAGALSGQLASEPTPGAGVAVQLSFVDKAGAYCRTFSVEGQAGLACRQRDAWALQALVAAAPAATTSMRPAATALPKALLDAVDERIAGSPLGAEAERQARDKAWRR